jgi:hypothetical protein
MRKINVLEFVNYERTGAVPIGRVQIEAHCRREREPAAEILSVLREGTRSCPAPDEKARWRGLDLAAQWGCARKDRLKPGHPPVS